MMFFAVYQLHFRLPEPGVHAQPLVQTPPMLHLEGLHTVHWLMSKMDTLSQTVRGDCQRFALKDHDSSMLIPHVPLPLTAGPFLLDTIKNSKYVVLPHHPNVKLDKKEVGIFFWLIASPWRCIEIPAPKFVNKLTAKGVMRGRAKAAAKRMKGIDDAKEAIDKLEDAKRFDDDMTPDEYHEADQKIEEHKQKISDLEAEQAKDIPSHADAKQYAESVDSDMGKAPKGESEADGEQRQWELEHEAKAEEISEKAARSEKRDADTEARNAKGRADAHDAQARENFRQAAGASGGGDSGSIERGEAHEAKAKEHREAAEKAEARAKAAEQKANTHAKNARESRRRKNKKENRQQSAKDYAAKQGAGKNPYKEAMGTGNVAVLAPSLLAHVPFPCTVFIYRDFGNQFASLLRFAGGQILEYVKGVVGFIFDSLGAGRGMLGEQAVALAKAVSEMLFDAAKGYAEEGKVSFKLSTKHGPVTVSAELTQGEDGQWSWKASGKAEYKDSSIEASREHKVSSTDKDGKKTTSESTTTSVKVKTAGDVEGSVSHTTGTKTKEGGGTKSVEHSDGTSMSAKAGPGEMSVSEEHTETNTTEGGKTTLEETDTTTTNTKVGHGPAEISQENKVVNTENETGRSTETSTTTTDKLGPAERSRSSGSKVETTSEDGKEVNTVTTSSSETERLGPVDRSKSSETKVTSTTEGTNTKTEKSQTSLNSSTTNRSQDRTSIQESETSRPPPPVDFSHGAPAI